MMKSTATHTIKFTDGLSTYIGTNYDDKGKTIFLVEIEEEHFFYSIEEVTAFCSAIERLARDHFADGDLPHD